MRVACSTVAALLLVLVAGPALADVIEVSDDGAARTRAGAGAVTWSGGVAEVGDSVPDVAVTVLEDPAAPANYRASLATAASRYAVSPALLAALVSQESGWRAGAVSAKGAVGLSQLMPGTARGLGVDARDPVANLDGGARYLRAMLDRFDGDVERALAAYNAGPARVAGARGVPAIAETRAYVASILARLQPAAPAPPHLQPDVITTASLVR